MTRKIRVEKARNRTYEPYNWLVLSPGGNVLEYELTCEQALSVATKHFRRYNLPPQEAVPQRNYGWTANGEPL